MIHDEFQDSESSKSGDDELIIKPPQSSSELDSALHHKDEKKQRHSKEYKSNKRHHHHHHHHHYHHSHNHKSRHLKSSSATTSSTRNRNMESKSFHYRDNKGKDQNRESERSLTDQDIVDARSKRLIKDVTESDSGRNVKYDEITDVRDVRLVKDIRESKRYKNEEKNTHFEEMKVEWRKKRLQWLQHQKDEDGTLLVEKEDLQVKNCEKELNENYKNIDLEYSRSEKNIRDRLQIDGETYYCLISPVSSEEESMNYEETEKSQELIDEEIEHVSNEEDSTKLSDVSSGDNDGESTSEEESVETISSSENEKDVSQKESLTTEPDKEAAYKKEDQNSKPIEANAIPEKKDLFLEQPDVQTPKRPVYCPAIQGCRSIDGFHVLNRIEEGTYGVVYRARDKETKEIVALKRLKMEREKEGFPITSLREINTLLKAQHPNIVTVREIVVGSNMDRIYIVMDYVEHDIKSLMKTMPRPFLIGEVKTLLMQLLCAVAHLHDNWILHRDLKTSNLLLSHDGILKVGDFGLAREYGSPLKSYTSVVVTLWYRAPELLLGAKKYSTPIDMWSVGCIFAELLTKNALFPGKSESDQINRIFKDLGTPSEKIWPGYSELPLVKSINITQYPYNNLKSRFSPTFTDLGFDLLNRFLTYNPARRISAEKAKSHAFFNEKPKPVPPNMFPTWPAKSEQEYRTARSSPKPPLGGIHYSRQ